MDFCKSFNDKTKDFKDSTPIPVVITAFSDRTFTYEMKTPQTTYLIKQATGIKAGASKPGDEVWPFQATPASACACLPRCVACENEPPRMQTIGRCQRAPACDGPSPVFH